MAPSYTNKPKSELGDLFLPISYSKISLSRLCPSLSLSPPGFPITDGNRSQLQAADSVIPGDGALVGEYWPT
jgi:hypothetical protein